MQMRKVLIAGLILLTATVGFAQSAKLKGKVLDSSGLIMPGASVKVYQGDKVVKEGTTTATGEFDIAVNPGDYKLEVTAPDFETSVQTVKVTPTMAPIDVTMNLAVMTTNVDVTDDGATVSLDADSSLSTTTLSGDTLSDLPDDETELQAYLQQLAGSRGGADTGGGSGGFVIDGFSGGRLPPKDQIQEIRINNNPYSTEFSGVGFGRVEVITRAGTGNYTGSMQFNFRDESLDAKNPFARAASGKPGYQTRNFNTNYGGPLIKNKLSVNFRANSNTNENSNTIFATLADGSIFNKSIIQPSTNRGFNARGQWAVTKNNVLNFNYTYGSNNRKNQGLNNEFTLPERASDSKSNNYEFQVRETAIIKPTLVHEVRFELQHNTDSSTPRTNGLTINVLDAFNSGGGQNLSSSNDWNAEFGNLLMFSGKKWTTKAGVQVNRLNNRSLSYQNFLGTYTFSSLDNYRLGIPLQFTQTAGNPALDLKQTEFGSFWQNDWKVSPKFTFSAGVRYEAQTNLHDYNNIDPRIGFAIGLTKTSSIRGGAGIFHQRLNANNVEQLIRLDGTRQLQIVILNPVFDPLNPPSGAAATASSVRVRSDDLAAPYNANTSLSLEKAWGAGLSTTFAWDTVRGIHLLRSRNINAPYPGTPLSDDLISRLNSRDTAIKQGARDEVDRLRPMFPNVGNVYQLESTGKSRSNNFNVGFRENMPRLWSLQIFGFYSLGYNKSDAEGAFGLPVNSYDLRPEWSRSSFDTRNRFNTGVNFRIPTNTNADRNLLSDMFSRTLGNTFMMINVSANSSRPFNIVTGTDLNGDTSINDRPAGTVRNAGIGPSAYNVNMNFSKTVNLRHEKAGGANPAAGGGGGVNQYASSFAEPQRGGGGGGFPGGGGGQRGPGPGGPGGQRGPGGPGGRGGPNGMRQPQGPTMTFSANVNNLLNNTQLQNYNGTLTSSNFGRATRAQNGRTINLGLRFNF